MLLELKDIKKFFPIPKGFFQRSRGFLRVVNGVDLSLSEGENLGLVGESGSGKTTLARIILKLYPMDSGRVFFAGQDLTSLSSFQMRPYRRQMQMVFQDPYSSLDPRYTVRNIIREALIWNPEQLDKNEKEQRLVHCLKIVGLGAEALNRFPHEFSGGERQRIAIARALVNYPKLLILDEAVSSLDVLIQEQILELLKTIQQRFQMTYLFITHNLRVVKKICQKTAVMYRGKIVESATTEDIFKNPLHPYTQDLFLAAIHYRSSLRSQEYPISDEAPLIDQGDGHWVRQG